MPSDGPGGWTASPDCCIAQDMKENRDMAGAAAAPTLASLGGLRRLLANPGLTLHTLRHGAAVGQDSFGNRYFEERTPTRPDGRKRRWVIYAGGAREASMVPAEWHAWLHFLTDEPLSETARRPWQKPHQPNQTGSAGAYRPRGHEYRGGERRVTTGDYESWTPEG
ncbi:MAG: NADH:ubiquinone oxidoreductase [Acidiphilium sp. 20-67-58]|nr:MAG: NADH:ubiquinone oxidoreductase [Acidiphilium sp. 20-67-58]OYV86354.1 MAG: NADH:ubiquinone oxidoreductase [Acidiphilium sp. 21-68-69]